MTDGRTSGAVDGFGDAGIANNYKAIDYPSLEIKSKAVRLGQNKKMRSRRIYQLGLIMPCTENDEECLDDETKSR